MLAETGLAGTTHEIVAVFNPQQVAQYRKLVPGADERLFLKADEGVEEEGGVVFTEEVDGEVDVDNI